MAFRRSSFKASKGLLQIPTAKLLHGLMKQHQPASVRLSGLANKEKKQKKKKQKTKTKVSPSAHLPLLCIFSLLAIAIQQTPTPAQTNNLVSSLFYSLQSPALPHHLLKTFSPNYPPGPPTPSAQSSAPAP
jgi:hypothetical protein